MDTNFLLLSAQVQHTASVLNQAQSQFLLGVVAQSRSNVVATSLQRARAANQNVITGNLAAVTTGAQSANGLNVR